MDKYEFNQFVTTPKMAVFDLGMLFENLISILFILDAGVVSIN